MKQATALAMAVQTVSFFTVASTPSSDMITSKAPCTSPSFQSSPG